MSISLKTLTLSGVTNKKLNRFSYFAIAVGFLLSVSLGILLSTGLVKANGVIEINNCDELRLIGVDEDYPLSGNYVLTANINCESEDSEPGNIYYEEDFEDGAGGWTSGGVIDDDEGDPMANTWKLTEQTCKLTERDGDAVLAEWGPFSFESTVYGTSGNAGEDCEPSSNNEDSYIISPTINLPATEIGWVVQFDSWAYDEGGPCVDDQSIDSKDIAVTTDGGSTATPLNDCYELHGDTAEGDQLDYKKQKFSLSQYAEEEIQLMFRYYTDDSCCDSDLGWFIDNVVIYEGTIALPFVGIGADLEDERANYFNGTFDGQGHTISNLSVSQDDDIYYSGLFNYTDEDAVIKNVGLINGSVAGEDNSGTGGLVGRNYGTIENSYSGLSVSGGDRVGGLVGRNHGEIKDSYSTGNVVGYSDSVGGLVGRNYGTIERSWSNNDPGDGDYGVVGDCDTGGLVGNNAGDEEQARIIDSYSRSNILLDNSSCGAGGLVGYSYESEITNSFATGTVNSDEAEAVGGLIGNQDADTTINFSFWDTESSGIEIACGLDHEESDDCSSPENVQGKSTANMKKKATFTSDLGANSWNFSQIWNINGETNSGYPFHEVSSEDLNGDGISDINQPNVSGFVSPLTGKIVALEVDEQCEIEAVSIEAEATHTNQDPGFDYANGFMNFTVDCGENGYTTTVKQYFYEIDPSFNVRKYHPTTKAYFTIAGAQTTQQTINSKPVQVASYQVKDGGLLDIDDQENGIIVDPVGLGQAVVGAPNTGLGAKSSL